MLNVSTLGLSNLLDVLQDVWHNSLVMLGANGGQFDAEFIYSIVFVRSWELTK